MESWSEGEWRPNKVRPPPQGTLSMTPTLQNSITPRYSRASCVQCISIVTTKPEE